MHYLYVSPLPTHTHTLPSCARLIEEYEREVAQKALRERQKPQKTSLVDASLISASFGLGAPAQDRGGEDMGRVNSILLTRLLSTCVTPSKCTHANTHSMNSRMWCYTVYRRNSI